MTVAPGPQLSTGRLRVDAARAIAKLRDYQLADRTTWILEGVRAAVASGATSIDVQGDSNDVWLRWQGPVWPRDELPRLFDELVSPEPARSGHHLRLLATAVNSALGLDPAYVDVIAIPATGPALSARYEPDVLADARSDALRAIAVHEIARPEGEAGMLVHLRRSPGLDTLSYLLHGATPPELAVVTGACRDVSVPIRVGATQLQPSYLVRLPLGDDLGGYLAIIDPAEAVLPVAIMEVAERGVVLVRYEVDIGLDNPRGRVPVRLFVDAARMPTNASRSQVRRAEHPIAAAERRAKELMPELVAALAAKAVAGGRERAAAVALIAAAIAGSDWHASEIPSLLWPLSSLPLLRNAVGEARSISSHWQAAIYEGKQPLAIELSPWVWDIPWIPRGDDAAMLVGGPIDWRPCRRALRWANKQLSARTRFHRHDKRVARVNTDADPRMRMRIGAEIAGSGVHQTLFEGVSGEMCLRGDGIGGEVVLLVDGRELERLHLDAPVPYDAAVESDKLSPGDRYLGVARDAGFRAVDTALAAAVWRGLEAIAVVLLGEPLPDGYTAGPPDVETDARYVRGAFAMAIPDSSPLVRAPAWPTFDGRWLSIVELRALRVIGIALYDAPSIRDRVMLRVDRSERTGLRVHLPDVVLIDYETAPHTPVFASGCRLAVAEPGIRGTIEPALESSIVLHHAGARLAKIRFRPKLVACCIVADVDAAIPDPLWSKAIDTAGVESFDFEPWERALVRAVAAAMIGDPIEALRSEARDLEIGSHAARTVWGAITRHRDVIELLGDDLHARLRAHRMFHAHGDPAAKSVADLAEAFPVQLPFVDGAALPVVGFAPLVADLEIAAAVAKLAGRVAIDGAQELERRRASEVRDARLRAHRTKTTVPCTLAGGFAIQNGAVAPGTSGGIQLEILVEGRPFQHVIAAPDLPLAAIVDVDETRIDDVFEALREAAHKRVLADIRAAAGPLVLRDALAKPASLGDPGPLRTLTVAALEHGIIDHATREVLCTIPGFVTVQGLRVALAARRGKPIQHAAWDQPWIEGDIPDAPILRIPDGDGGSELRQIITALIRDPLVDASHDVAKTQGQRRIAHGLLPVPSVPDAMPELKKRLDELGQSGKELGPGEIALVTESQSIALLHVGGKPRVRVELDVLPPVCIAIEAPDLVAEVESFGNLFDKQRTSLTWQVQELAVRLVRKVINAETTIPINVRHGLRRAVLMCKFDPAEISGAAVVETTAGAWLPWSAIDAQLARFGDVWATKPSSTRIPLDDARIALRLTDIEITHGAARGIAVIDATRDLELDELARRNRARRPATSLEIAPDDRYLGFARLPGDGKAAARGMVALLHPNAFVRRGIAPHMAMHPFDMVSDPCAWPTFAVVDDARLSPGRTWERPVDDAAWKRVARDVQLASEEAWRSVAILPPDVISAVAIGTSSLAGVLSAQDSEGLEIHGALWLASRMATVMVVSDSTMRLPVRRDAIGGQLFVYAPHGWRRDSVINDLCVEAFPKLARMAVAKHAQWPGRVAAHVAMALALGRIGPGDADGVTFDCFEGPPVDAETLVARLRKPGIVYISERDSELVGTVSSYLGDRARRGVVKTTPRAAPRPAQTRPMPPDPVEALATSVRRRLDDIAIGWSGRVEVDRHSPHLAYYNDGTIMLGNDPSIATIAADPKLVDLLVAHVVTVLDVALTEITSSSQATAVYKLLRPQ